MLRMLWNVYSFYVLYANTDELDPTTVDVPVAERHELDRWIVAELHDVVRAVTNGMDNYDATGAGRRISAFVDDLSNWYVRRSRRRFWKEAEDRDKAAAHLTLHECLRTLALVLAPFTPFISDEIWDNIVVSVQPQAPNSVHLADWPTYDEAFIDEELRGSMAAARRAVALGLQARETAKTRVRQPLARAVVSGAGADLAVRHASIVADELNVKLVAAESAAPSAGAGANATDGGMTVSVDTEITPELRAEGMARELVRAVQNLRKKSGLAVADHAVAWRLMRSTALRIGASVCSGSPASCSLRSGSTNTFLQCFCKTSICSVRSSTKPWNLNGVSVHGRSSSATYMPKRRSATESLFLTLRLTYAQFMDWSLLGELAKVGAVIALGVSLSAYLLQDKLIFHPQSLHEAIEDKKAEDPTHRLQNRDLMRLVTRVAHCRGPVVRRPPLPVRTIGLPQGADSQGWVLMPQTARRQYQQLRDKIKNEDERKVLDRPHSLHPAETLGAVLSVRARKTWSRRWWSRPR